MAEKDLPDPSVLRSVKDRYATLIGKIPHRHLCSEASALLKDIEELGGCQLTTAQRLILDDYEVGMKLFLAESKQCQCSECKGRTEAA